MTRIFIGCLGTETNTFSSMPTGMATFEETMLYRGDATRHTPASFSVPLHTWRRMAEADGTEIIEGLAAFAQPAGITTRRVYETLRDALLDDLKRALPVDIVLVNMHGAMVADGYDDCEGDMCERIRAIVGPDMVFGVELDLHCSLTPQMTANTDAIVIYKEYPHIDVAERAEELYRICRAAHRGEVRPVMATFDTRMIAMWRTPVEPVKTFVAEMIAAEGRDGILSVSFAHGFPWGDVPEASAKMLVVADGDRAKAAALAERFGRRIFDLRHAITPQLLSVDAALDEIEATTARPLVLADVADNAGGGAPSDSTFILAAVLARGLSDVVIGYFWDPVAVRFCEEAGEGARIDLRVGGKCGPTSGHPVDVVATVVKIVPRAYQTYGDGRQTMGTAVWIRTDGGIDLVLTTKRTQVFHPDGFAQLGIDVASRRAVILKSIQHFYAGFEPVAARIAYVAADGAIPPDFGKIPFVKFTTPYWPRVEDPFATTDSK